MFERSIRQLDHNLQLHSHPMKTVNQGLTIAFQWQPNMTHLCCKILVIFFKKINKTINFLQGILTLAALKTLLSIARVVFSFNSLGPLFWSSRAVITVHRLNHTDTSWQGCFSATRKIQKVI